MNPGVAAAAVSDLVSIPDERHLFNLMGQQGSFESKPIPGRPGARTFGLWAFRAPKAGDIVIKPLLNNPSGMSAWLVERNATLVSRGDSGHDYWQGTMVDLYTRQFQHLRTVEIEDFLAENSPR